MEKTEFIVLQKRQYSESSLIVAGISPERGRLDFLARGARRYGKKQFPNIDLFRCFVVQYPIAQGYLHLWKEADLTADYSALAKVHKAYQTACWLARFAITNSIADNPAPSFFQALKTAFTRLAELAGIEPSVRLEIEERQRAAAIVPSLYVYLQENGLLPAANERQRSTLTRTGEILNHAVDPNLSPQLEIDEWRHAYRLAAGWLRRSHCTIPKTQ